jgi:hypothetical protein
MTGFITVKDGVTDVDELWRYARHLETRIAQLKAALCEVRSDINDYGFSDSFADETHKTIAKINVALASA